MEEARQLRAVVAQLENTVARRETEHNTALACVRDRYQPSACTITSSGAAVGNVSVLQDTIAQLQHQLRLKQDEVSHDVSYRPCHVRISI